MTAAPASCNLRSELQIGRKLERVNKYCKHVVAFRACSSTCSGGANMLHTQAYARTDANACDHAEDLTSVFDFAGLRTNAILKIVILSDDGE